MAVECTAFGLGLKVNAFLSALSGLPKPKSIDVKIDFRDRPYDIADYSLSGFSDFYHCRSQDSEGRPEFAAARSIADGSVRVSYTDGIVFLINADATHVEVFLGEKALPEYAAPALLGPMMGVVLRMRGVCCLHSSCVVIDGLAVALVAESGGGKSTTAAAFACLGFPVLTDDVLAITDCIGHFEVRPAYPRVRLWPESVEGLFGSSDALPRMMPGWDKRYLGLLDARYQFQDSPLPLAAIYFLQPRQPQLLNAHFENMGLAKATLALISDSFATNFQTKAQRAAEFEQIVRLASSIPLRSVTAPDDFSKIKVLCESIADDFRVMTSHGVAA